MKVKKFVSFLFILLGFVTLRANDSIYLNVNRIIISEKTIVQPTQAEIEWGKSVLSLLNIEKLTEFEKSRVIQNYISSNFKYRIRSPRTINSIIENKGGNCVSHTIMGLFFLRLAGIPAKICYEYHIRNYSIIDKWRANRQKAGYFGASHNSHFWIMFYDGVEWQPFDSALGITGFDDFFRVRTKTQRWPYLLSFNPRRMTGAPFIVQVETGNGTKDMALITKEIWKREFKWYNEKVTREDWLEFVNAYSEIGTNDFKYPLSKSRLKNLRLMSRMWF